MCGENYAYTRFEELQTLIFTNEHKATLSKESSHIYIDIDDLKMFRDLYSEKSILRTKKEYKDMLYKINNKISKINGSNKMSGKIRKKIELIYQSMFKLHDDLWLRLDDLNKIDAIIDD